MTPERVHGHVRLVAGLDLVGFEEAQLVCYSIAGVLGCLLGAAVSRVLGVLL